MTAFRTSAAITSSNGDGSYHISVGPYGWNSTIDDFVKAVRSLGPKEIFEVLTAQGIAKSGLDPNTMTIQQLNSIISNTTYGWIE